MTPKVKGTPVVQEQEMCLAASKLGLKNVIQSLASCTDYSEPSTGKYFVPYRCKEFVIPPQGAKLLLMRNYPGVS